MLRVIGVGDNFVDRYLDDGIMYPGGNSVNFAVYASQMGVESAYCGVFASDKEAQLVRGALDSHHVDYTRSTFLPDGETGKGSIRLVEGDRVITDDNDGGSVKKDPLKITDTLTEYLASFDVIHTCCYGYLTEQLPRLAACGVPLVYDFSDQWGDSAFRRFCPYIDVAFLSGGNLPRGQLEEALRCACACGASVAIATCGSQGALAFRDEKIYPKKPYRPNGEILDTMGAGDAFLTGFTVAYYSGKKLYNAITRAQPAISPDQGDEKDFFDRLMEYALCAANLRALKSCMTRGAFGMGAPIPGAAR